jgi:DNA-binding Lrp family transcriptional regulator
MALHHASNEIPVAVNVDAIDVQLLELLTKDGRISNRFVASKVGLTEGSVASRLRRLIDEGILVIRPKIDWLAAGFNAHAFVFVRTACPPTRFIRSCEAISGVHSISILVGDQDVLVSVIASDFKELYNVIAQTTDHVDVISVEVQQTIDFLKFSHQASVLPLRPPLSLEDLPAPTIDLDEVDSQIMASLQIDGRMSYREIARRLGVSDGMIRQRSRCLRDSGLMRVIADRVETGAGRVLAMVGISISNPIEAINVLLRLPEAGTSLTSLGRFNLLFFVTITSDEPLSQWLDRNVRSLTGLRALCTWTVTEAPFLRSDLVRFVDHSSPSPQ